MDLIEMQRRWVSTGPRSFRWRYGLFVNKILNLMTEADATVHIMTMLLMISTIFSWVISWWKRVWKGMRF